MSMRFPADIPDKNDKADLGPETRISPEILARQGFQVLARSMQW
ncbi:hypothetical protein ACFONG_06385 [Uliginosibacterium paludis]|uniref:Uncharacterized protein n=1 Tax=Uliginosibacterium paludis TaxID=1615952 RepID=A0ABV2CLI0_9RHOO